MIQSRNVAIAALVVLLLTFFGVGRLLFWETAGSTPAFMATTHLAGGPSHYSGVADETETFNRSSYLESLRDAVRSRMGSFVPPTPELESLITDPEGLEEREDDPVTIAGDITIKWCDATVLESQFVATWPQGEVRVVAREGARIVELNPVVVSQASGTSQANLTLMQFPLRPPLRAESACLTHSYIGVTETGRLIHNNDVVLYQSYGSNDLIGYAFDGNPIYGLFDGATDQCGGVAGAEYRYHLSSERSFILGCFMSEPTQMLLVG